MAQTLVPDQNETLHDTEPLKPASNSLMITTAKIAGINARVLIDSGAEINHISLGFCQRHKIATRSETATAVMANGSIINLRTTKLPLTISIGGYTEKMRLVANTQTYDLILGKNGVMSTEPY